MTTCSGFDFSLSNCLHRVLFLCLIVFWCCSLSSGAPFSTALPNVNVLVNSASCATPADIYQDPITQTLLAACGSSGIVGVYFGSSSSSPSLLSSSSSSSPVVNVIVSGTACQATSIQYSIKTQTGFASCGSNFISFPLQLSSLVPPSSTAVFPLSASSVSSLFTPSPLIFYISTASLLSLDDVSGLLVFGVAVSAPTSIGLPHFGTATSAPTPPPPSFNTIVNVVALAMPGYGVKVNGTIGVLYNVTTKDVCMVPVAFAYVKQMSQLMVVCDTGVFLFSFSSSSSQWMLSQSYTQITNILEAFYEPILNTVYVTPRNANTYNIPLSSGVSSSVMSFQACNVRSMYFDVSSTTLFASCSAAPNSFLIGYRNSAVTTIVNSSQCLYGGSIKFDPYTSTLFAACIGGVISVRGLSSSIVIPGSQCASASSSTFDPTTRTLFATCATQYFPTILYATNGVVAPVNDPLRCARPSTVVYDQPSNTLFVACYFSVNQTYNIAMISSPTSPSASIETSLISTPLTTLSSFFSLAYDAPTLTLYASAMNSASSIVAVNVQTGAITTTIATMMQCTSPNQIVWTTPTLYAACYAGPGVISYSMSSGLTTVVPFATCNNPVSIFYDATTLGVYAACNMATSSSSSIIRYDISSQRTGIFATASQCPAPSSVVYDKVTTSLFALCSNGVLLITGSTSTLLSGSVGVSSLPFFPTLSYDATTMTLYVSSYANGVYGIGFRSCGLGFFFTFDAGCLPCPLGYAASTRLLSSSSSSLSLFTCSVCLGGTFSNVTGSATCLPCAAGTWSSFGATFCSPCQAGYTGKGQSNTQTCDGPCPAGFVCPFGFSTPANCSSPSLYCPAGLFSSLVAPPGYYTYGGSAFTRTSIAPCPAGYYCAAGTLNPCGSRAVYCPPGSAFPLKAPDGMITVGYSNYPPPIPFSPNVNVNSNGNMTQYSFQTGISPCPPGSSCTLGSPTPCPAGSFSSVSSLGCVSCPFPLVASHSNSTSCTRCTAGTYYSTSTLCAPCLPGTYSAVDGATLCNNCSAGSVQQNVGQTSCLSCEPGKFATQPFQCFQCDPGFYSSTPGATQCQACQPGTYASNSAQTSCSSCPTMTYASANATIKCADCSIGQYTLNRGTFSCYDCPSLGVDCHDGHITVFAGYFAFTVATSLNKPVSLLVSGSTSTNSSSSSSGSSSSSSNNSTSATAVTTATTTTMTTMTASSTFMQLEVQPCSTSLCVGAPLNVDYLYATTTTTVVPVSTLQCAANRDPNSLLCGQCLPNYSDYSGNCTYCPSVNWGVVILLLVAAFIYTAFLHSSAQNSDMNPLPILMYFIQIALLVTGPLQSFLTWLSFFSLSSPSSSSQTSASAPASSSTSSSSSSSSSLFDYCLGPFTGIDNFIVSYIVPLIFFMELLLVACVLCLYRKCRGLPLDSSSPVEEKSTNRCSLVTSLDSIPCSLDAFIRTAVSLLFYTYTSIAVTTFNWLHCTTVDGVSVVYSAPSIVCTSTSYAKMSVVVYCMLIIDVIGLPLCVGLFLYLKRSSISAYYAYRSSEKQHVLDEVNQTQAKESLFKKSNDDSQLSSSSSSSSMSIKDRVLNDIKRALVPSLSLPNKSSFAKRFGIMFELQTVDCYYWIVFTTIRRTISAALASALPTDISGRALGLFLVHFVSLLIHLYMQPYRHRASNVLETISLTVLTVISVFVSSYQLPPYPISVQVWVCLLVLFTILVAIIMIAGSQWYLSVRSRLTQEHQTLKTIAGDRDQKSNAQLEDQRHQDDNQDHKLKVKRMASELELQESPLSVRTSIANE